MPKTRKALELRHEEKSFVARFRHPISQKVMRVWLGRYPEDAQSAQAKLDRLNAAFLNPASWANPDLQDENLLRIWREGALGVKVKSGRVSMNGQEIPTSVGNTAALVAIVEKLQQQLADARHENSKIRKLYEAVAGRKMRVGPSPSLRAALDSWKMAYQGRDSEHTKIVGFDLERFVNHFKGETAVDALDGREKEIEDWLRSLTKEVGTKEAPNSIPISAGRRQQIRRHVLRFLEDSGLRLNRKSIATPSRKDVRRDRGAIRWLQPQETRAMLKALPDYWCEVFELQEAIGLRPSELPTLKASDFTDDHNLLTLSPSGPLTLKTGSRKISLKQLPRIKRIVRNRLDVTDHVFAAPDGQPWKTAEEFCRHYNAALDDAKGIAGVRFKMDARVPRRTCASRLKRAGVSDEAVAALLGDDPRTIREHYGRIESHEVNLNPKAST